MALSKICLLKYDQTLDTTYVIGDHLTEIYRVPMENKLYEIYRSIKGTRRGNITGTGDFSHDYWNTGYECKRKFDHTAAAST
jgi:hypothetical protein